MAITLTRKSNGTIELTYEDQIFNASSGGMDKQMLGQLTLHEDTWRKVLLGVQQMLDDPRRMMTGIVS